MTTIVSPPKTRREARAAQQQRQAKLIACSGPSGSGKSTVALNLAYQLARSGAGVLLIDADTQAPTLATALALGEFPAGLAPLIRLARQKRLTDIEFAGQSMVLRFGKAKVTFVPGISVSRWPEITPAGFQEFLEFAEQRFDHVVVDCASDLEAQLFAGSSPVGRNEFTRWILASAEQVVLTLSADPVGVARFLGFEAEFAQLRGGRDTALIVNKYRQRVIGAGAKKEIARTLKACANRRVNLFVQHQPKVFDDALRLGSPITSAKAINTAGLGLAKLVSWPHSPSS